MKRVGWGMLGLLALTGCGGYDADYDCEQTAACQERITGQPVTDTEIDLCADFSDGVYDDLSDAEQNYLDDVFEACEDEESCGYIVCVCEYGDRGNTTCEDARQHL